MLLQRLPPGLLVSLLFHWFSCIFNSSQKNMTAGPAGEKHYHVAVISRCSLSCLWPVGDHLGDAYCFVPWMAPETYSYGEVERSQIWSLAVVVWEIFSFADVPFYDAFQRMEGRALADAVGTGCVRLELIRGALWPDRCL